MSLPIASADTSNEIMLVIVALFMYSVEMGKRKDTRPSGKRTRLSDNDEIGLSNLWAGTE